MKGYQVLFILVTFLFFTGCASNIQKNPVTPQQALNPAVTITPVSTQESCVKILGEVVNKATLHFVYSDLTVQNNCGKYVIFDVKYSAYETDGTPYRGFVPERKNGGTLEKSETKTIRTELPENWFTETEEIARTQYNHGIVAKYDVIIDKIQMEPTPTRASVVSNIAGEITAQVTPAKKLVDMDPCGGYAKGWGNEC